MSETQIERINKPADEQHPTAMAQVSVGNTVEQIFKSVSAADVNSSRHPAETTQKDIEYNDQRGPAWLLPATIAGT
jgi:hypothetical protein